MDYETFWKFLRDMGISFDVEYEDGKRLIYVETPYPVCLNEYYTFTFDEQGKMIGGEPE